MQRQQILGCAIVLGTLLMLSLIGGGVTHHRASIHGSWARLLWIDVAVVLVYGLAGALVWKQRSPRTITALVSGAQIGLCVGAVGIANHLIEAFVPVRHFVLIIGPVLLILTLLGAAGSMTWERSGSLPLALIGGLCCGIVGTLITLCFAASFNLLFAAHVDWQLRDAFAASGMVDRAAFRVRNILEASSEILVRMPLAAICLALAGATIHAWIGRESRRQLLLGAGVLASSMFAVGAAALWHANAIERVARPPFVLSGILLTGVSLCAAYPIWSSLHHSRGPTGIGCSINGIPRTKR